MKARAWCTLASLAVVSTLSMPADVAADCRLAFHIPASSWAAKGATRVGANANFGLGDADQTVLGVNVAYAFSEKAGILLGGGRCLTSGLDAFSWGANTRVDLWNSPDGKTALQGSLGLNFVNFSGSKTFAFPIGFNVRYEAAPTVRLFAGPEFAIDRFSAMGFSSSESVFGANGGAMVDLNEDLCFWTALGAQFWEGSSEYSVHTGVSLAVNE